MLFNNIRKIYKYSKTFAINNHTNTLLTVLDCLCCKYIHGFSNREFFIGGGVNVRFFRRKNFATYRRALKIINTFNNKDYIHYFDNKVDFLTKFSKYINRDWFYCKAGEYFNYQEFIKKYNKIIRKPLNSWQGKGVTLLNKLDSEKEYNILVENKVLLEEYIEQNSYMCFGNKSINTIRIFTVLDKSGQVHLIKSVLRAGVGDSLVDNFCAGGIVYSVDDETGIIDSRGLDEFGNRYIYHPKTKICMLGFQIPFWKEVVNLVKEAALIVPEVRWIGWDVAISTKGPLLVEANHNPDQEFLEFFGNGFLYKEIMKFS